MAIKGHTLTNTLNITHAPVIQANLSLWSEGVFYLLWWKSFIACRDIPHLITETITNTEKQILTELCFMILGVSSLVQSA